jgi:DNA-binding CsgD family transcriptional regulator
MIESRLAKLATEATSHRAYREGALALLREAIPFDGALMHALSPRVPLETAVIVGIDPQRIAQTMPGWDALAVELGRLRDLANEKLAASDQEAFPLSNPNGSEMRARFYELALKPIGAQSLLIAHLIVRGQVHGAVLLTGRTPSTFTDAHLQTLRALAPMLALGDLLHAQLDQTERASAPVMLTCTDGRLTPRQREIVEHVAHGHTNEAIASALGISANTLRNHLATIFAKLGAANRADVVRLAVLSNAR